MKKIIIAFFVISILPIHSLAFADSLPPDSKSINVCATITNMADHPEVTLLRYDSYKNSPTLAEGDQQPPELVKNGDCVESFYNIYVDSRVYVVDSNYWKTQSSNTGYDPSVDQNAYQLDFGSEPPMDDVVEESSNLKSVKYYYSIEGTITKEDKKVLSLSFIKKETTLQTPDNTPPIFTDVAYGSTYYDALFYLRHQFIVSGYDDGSFKPDNMINRAEFTKIIVGASPNFHVYGQCMKKYVNPDGSYKNLFTDVLSPKGSEEAPWYLDYVCNAKSDHLINGYPDGSFKPAQNINYAEAAKIIANGFGLTSSTSTSTPWYKVYVDALVAKDAVPASITTPGQNITRGEMAEMIYRIKKSL